MDRDHRGQPARPIAEHMDMLVIVEIGEIPDSGHGTHLHVKKLREGVIKQRRHRVTPKLRKREKGKKMGRPMGHEPTTRTAESTLGKERVNPRITGWYPGK